MVTRLEEGEGHFRRSSASGWLRSPAWGRLRIAEGGRGMRKRAIVLAACVALGVPDLPTPGLAAGRLHSAVPVNVRTQPDFRPKSAFGSPGGFPFRAVQNHRGAPHLVPRHRLFPRFVSTGFSYVPPIYYSPLADTAPTVVTVEPVIYASPVVYVSTPVVTPQPLPAPAAPAAPPMASIVEHPTGRYELRGDGAGTPYTWVWIPNPPPAPPAASPSRGEAPTATPAPTRRSQVYRWTDEQGTEFWTNSVEKVPEPYRSGTRGPA
jgi:hypothetical protein